MTRIPLSWRAGLAQVVLVAVAALAVSLAGASLVREAVTGAARPALARRLELLAAQLATEGTAPSASRLAELARAEGVALWIERADGSTLGAPPGRSADGAPVVTATAALGGGARLGGASRPAELPARLRRWHLGVVAAAAALAAALLGATGVAFRRLERSLASLASLAAGGEVADHPAGLPSAESLLASTQGTVEGLRRQLAALSSRHDQLQAVLASMVEAVVVVDEDQRVLFVNEAARELLALAAERTVGRPLGEVVRSAELQRLLERAAPGSPAEGELALSRTSERFLQAHCARVVGSDGHALGSVLVLGDITRLRRLERVRRDFVANVSHEIKTPITAIAGFVETLLDGSLRDADETRRFLGIVKRHADRLEAIVEDLLMLARIEQEGEAGTVVTEDAAVSDVLRAAAEACRFLADQKGIALVVESEPTLRARMNAPLVEQALVNLIDNAIKHSPERSAVTVSARATPVETVLTVADRGSGIAAADLPRLFERFYRVDRARSRQSGGTGLGLAIVKHVAQVHGGRATVESSLGEGSAFALHLPVGPPGPARPGAPDAGSPPARPTARA